MSSTFVLLIAIFVVALLIVRMARSGLTVYGKRSVSIATVEYGDIKGVYTVRMTLTHEGATLTRNDTFGRRADAEDFFTNYSIEQVLEALEQVQNIIGDKS